MKFQLPKHLKFYVLFWSQRIKVVLIEFDKIPRLKPTYTANQFNIHLTEKQTVEATYLASMVLTKRVGSK